jgi:hypothetical protein
MSSSNSENNYDRIPVHQRRAYADRRRREQGRPRHNPFVTRVQREPRQISPERVSPSSPSSPSSSKSSSSSAKPENHSMFKPENVGRGKSRRSRKSRRKSRKSRKGTRKRSK